MSSILIRKCEECDKMFEVTEHRGAKKSCSPECVKARKLEYDRKHRDDRTDEEIEIERKIDKVRARNRWENLTEEQRKFENDRTKAWQKNNSKQHKLSKHLHWINVRKDIVLEQRLKIIDILSKNKNECDCCKEKLDLSLDKLNLTIHHKYYDGNDKNGSHILTQINSMLQNEIDITEKFGVLCFECNFLEGMCVKSTDKVLKMAEWIKQNKRINPLKEADQT